MRKFILFTSLTVISLGTTFMSCKKTDSKFQESDKSNLISGSGSLYSLDTEGFLIFSSRDQYESALDYLGQLSNSQLDSFETSMDFQSARSAFWDNTGDSLLSSNEMQTNHNSSIEDELLLRIINPDGLIEIEGTVFKLVADSSVVYSMNDDYKADYLSNFKTGNYDYEVMNQLNNESVTDEYDDVFDLVAAKPIGVTIKELNPFKETPGQVTDPGGIGPYYRGRGDVIYQKAVIYHSLIGKLHYEKKFGAIWGASNTNMKVFHPDADTYCQYKRKGGNLENMSPPNDLTSIVYDNKMKWRPYQGRRKVTYTRFKMHFYFNLDGVASNLVTNELQID